MHYECFIYRLVLYTTVCDDIRSFENYIQDMHIETIKSGLEADTTKISLARVWVSQACKFAVQVLDLK